MTLLFMQIYTRKRMVFIMIQDIAPHHYDNTYSLLPPRPQDYALCYEPHKAFLRREPDGIAFPTFQDLASHDHGLREHVTYLFSIDGRRFYLADHLDPLPLSGFAMENTEIFRLAEPQHLAFAGITGYQLYQWYRSCRFCGSCGAVMKKDGKERMLYCPDCGAVEYPKISPAVIIAVTHKNHLLLSKYAGRSYKKYALLAGFVEIGETVEETVKREVMEEVGLSVTNIRYYKSQPWSFSGTVLMGFFCDLDGDDETIILDENELSLAEWFDRESIPVSPSRDSLTNEMIMTFIQGRAPR